MCSRLNGRAPNAAPQWGCWTILRLYALRRPRSVVVFVHAIHPKWKTSVPYAPYVPRHLSSPWWDVSVMNICFGIFAPVAGGAWVSSQCWAICHFCRRYQWIVENGILVMFGSLMFGRRRQQIRRCAARARPWTTAHP